jgi:phenolic acid decarboxylase
MTTIGAGGSWSDNTGTTAGMQTAVTKQGVQIVRFHPQYLNDPDKLATAELSDFLDWLKAEQDAGRVKVLTFRDAMSATR